MQLTAVMNNKKGWAMPLVLLLVAILPLLAAAVYNYTSVEIRQIEVYRDAEQAEYLAKSYLNAVINNWKQNAFDSKPTGGLERVYYMSGDEFIGEFILQSAWSVLSPDIKEDETIGYVDVTVQTISDSSDPAFGSTRFIATAVSGGATKRVSVASSPYGIGHETLIPLYDYETGHFNYDLAPTESRQTVSKTIGGRNREKEIIVRAFDPHGILEMKTDSASFYLDADEFVGIGANMITFHKTVDLNKWDDEMGLILASEVVVFKQPVKLRIGISSYGTIVFQVPEDMGIQLEGKTGTYAKVYFAGGANLTRASLFGATPKKSVIQPGESYYIKKSDSADNAFDLVEWMMEVGIDTEYFFKITDAYNNGDDVLLPVVNDHLTFLLEES